jgi:hypothetical protein
MAGVRHDGIEIDLEALRELDLLEIAPDGVGAASFLRDGPGFGRSRALEGRKLFEIAGRLWCGLSESGRRKSNGRDGGKPYGFRGDLPGFAP